MILLNPVFHIYCTILTQRITKKKFNHILKIIGVQYIFLPQIWFGDFAINDY